MPPASAIPAHASAFTRAATEDEILGLAEEGAKLARASVNAKKNSSPQDFSARSGHGASTDARAEAAQTAESEFARGADPVAGEKKSASASDANAAASENISAALDAHPELRRAWDDAAAYRQAYSTAQEARESVALLADLNRLDALFFSRRPEDHAALAREVARLDPAAFASLAQAIAAHAATPTNPPLAGARHARPADSNGADAATGLAPAQAEFFSAANSAAVERVLEAIETQVDRLLPEGTSKSAHNRVVGEIYRELDATLRANRQLNLQMRQAFRSGTYDAEHQRAIVSLIASRARQALPGVAKRVMTEWTSTLVSANHERRARQQSAERRVDIGGASGGNDGRRPITPRDLDYRRLSDSDILNM